MSALLSYFRSMVCLLATLLFKPQVKMVTRILLESSLSITWTWRLRYVLGTGHYFFEWGGVWGLGNFQTKCASLQTGELWGKNQASAFYYPGAVFDIKNNFSASWKNSLARKFRSNCKKGAFARTPEFPAKAYLKAVWPVCFLTKSYDFFLTW